MAHLDSISAYNWTAAFLVSLYQSLNGLMTGPGRDVIRFYPVLFLFSLQSTSPDVLVMFGRRPRYILVHFHVSPSLGPIYQVKCEQEVRALTNTDR